MKPKFNNRKSSRRNILFVCSRNKWRSKTAETIFKDNLKLNVKSAGTSNNAEKTISQELILWADEIFVMEKKHKEILEQKFGRNNQEITILNIPDDYKYMDEELIEELNSSVSL